MKFVFIIFAGAFQPHWEANRFYDAAWSGAFDSVFDFFGNPTIADWDDDGEHQDKNTCPRAASPEQCHAEDEQQREEPDAAGEIRHDFVEDGIRERFVDEAKRRGVNRLDPGHSVTLKVE